MLNGLAYDLRHAWRALRRQPGFTVSAVLVLALGIGINTAIFSMVNAVLLDPLRVERPERLVRFGNRWTKLGVERGALSGPDAVERARPSRTLVEAGIYATDDASLAGDGAPERVFLTRASSGVFRALRAPARLGRVFAPEEDRVGSDRVVLLSDGLWRRRFGGDAGIVGRRVRLDGVERVVVGVMPPRFAFPTPDVQLWTPLALPPSETDPSRRGNEWIQGVARLRDGATLEQAIAEHQSLAAAAIRGGSPSFTSLGYGADVWPLQDDATRPYRGALLLLLGAVAFLLLVACVNIAHLVLARAATRRREIAIREAIGAGRGRIARQLLAESVLLGLVGGACGMVLAAWLVELLPALRIAGLPAEQPFPLDGRVLAYATLVSAACGALFGLAPIVDGARLPLAESLRAAGALGGPAGTRSRAALVAVEAAFTVLLLVGAGLMFRSLTQLGTVRPGFDAEQALIARTTLPAATYPDSARQATFFRRLVDRISGMPGVAAAGAVLSLPLQQSGASLAYRTSGQEGSERRQVAFRIVEGDYFRAAGIPLRRGSTFSEAGRLDRAHECVIDEGLAREAFGTADPIGQHILWGGAPPLTVVGVVGAVRGVDRGAEPAPVLYLTQSVYPQSSLALVVRADAGVDPIALAPALRAAVREQDPELSVYDVMPMRSLVSQSLASPRTRALMLGTFALLALLLAVTGIYGVSAYQVSQRTREIGVRMALGARPGQVLALVVRRGMQPVVWGVAIGIALSFPLGRLIASQLYGVRPSDPVTLTVLPLVLLVVALAGTALPARRAARIAPMAALRSE